MSGHQSSTTVGQTRSVSAAKRAMLGYIEAFRAADMHARFELFASDASVRFPFAPKEFPSKLDGIAAIRAYYKDTPKPFRFDRYFDIAVHDMSDEDMVVAKFKCMRTIVANGKPYDQTYISTLRVQDGKISHYQEFWNPIVVLEALGGQDAMNAAFNAAPSSEGPKA